MQLTPPIGLANAEYRSCVLRGAKQPLDKRASFTDFIEIIFSSIPWRVVPAGILAPQIRNVVCHKSLALNCNYVATDFG